MEPISIVLLALTLGIAAGLKSTAEKAVKDTYEGLKQFIENRYKISLSGLENDPNSQIQQAAVKESLGKIDADQDEELLDKAKSLIDLINSKAPETTTAIGINLDEVEAEYLKAKDIIAKGQKTAAVKIRRSQFKGGIELGNITADSGTNAPNS